MKVRVLFKGRHVCDLSDTPDGAVYASGPDPHGFDEQLRHYGRRASGRRLLELLLARVRGVYWHVHEVGGGGAHDMAEGEPGQPPRPDEPPPRPQAPAPYEPHTDRPLVPGELYHVLHAATNHHDRLARNAMLDWYKDNGVPGSHDEPEAIQAEHLARDPAGTHANYETYHPSDALDGEMVRIAEALSGEELDYGAGERPGAFVYRVLPLIDSLDPRHPEEARFARHLRRHNFAPSLYNVVGGHEAPLEDMAEGD